VEIDDMFDANSEDEDLELNAKEIEQLQVRARR
jgi:hypothetical protein